jgi:Mrp family chromosome partitioning ATPase/capsular polysaccharide biosynthesis protein
MDRPNNAQARIADYIRPLTSRWWLIVAAVVVATAGVYIYYARKPNVYSASTLVYYQDPGDPVTGTPSLPSTDRTVADQAVLLDSQATARAVAHQLGTGSPAALLQQVGISSKPGEDFITIGANAGTPTQAAAIANAFARHLVSSLSGGVSLRIANALRLTQSSLAQLAPGPASSAQRTLLEQQLSRLQLALRVPTTVARQVNPATAPTAPSSPKPLRNALFALVLSLIVAVSIAYGLERFDRRLKNPDEMERAYQRSLLAVLPHTSEPNPVQNGQPTLSWDFREPFRVLRTNLELETLDSPPRTIVVSSAMPGEGKSTVARNLALAFREAGKSVAIVDLDLRHPTLAASFGSPDGPGVTEVLRHETTLDEAVVRLDVGLHPVEEFFRAKREGRLESENDASSNGNGSAGTANGHNGHGSSPQITLLPAGAKPANPGVVLASERLVEVVNELRARHDVVIIDSAPVLAVSDTVPLLRYADGALLVGRLDVTTRDTARRVMESIARVPDMTLLGVVANDLSRLEASGYGYGYGYGYGGYGDKPQSKTRLGRSRDRSKQPV